MTIKGITTAATARTMTGMVKINRDISGLDWDPVPRPISFLFPIVQAPSQAQSSASVEVTVKWRIATGVCTRTRTTRDRNGGCATPGHAGVSAFFDEDRLVPGPLQRRLVLWPACNRTRRGVPRRASPPGVLTVVALESRFGFVHDLVDLTTRHDEKWHCRDEDR
jgi:hypothetical protein